MLCCFNGPVTSRCGYTAANVFYIQDDSSVQNTFELANVNQRTKNNDTVNMYSEPKFNLVKQHCSPAAFLVLPMFIQHMLLCLRAN